eukprot:TRINITY_DN16348_c0_g1_i1.p1 TRINITY_DN16348_c0_g1~~TRINITY_DN16348_c0_g1_i1.p1  ORF type:complete len:259 (+),score=39.47 TRINITY_DN16348_c0_g1_i1:84-779(+)
MAKARAALVVHRNDEILYFNSIELAKHYIDKTTGVDDVSRRTGAVRRAMQIHSDLNTLNDSRDEYLHAAIRRSTDIGSNVISKEELRVAKKINRKANEAKHCWDVPCEASDNGLTSDSTSVPFCYKNDSDGNGPPTKHTKLDGVSDTATRATCENQLDSIDTNSEASDDEQRAKGVGLVSGHLRTVHAQVLEEKAAPVELARREEAVRREQVIYNRVEKNGLVFGRAKPVT